MEEGRYADAAVALGKLGDYKDAKATSRNLWDGIAYRKMIDAGNDHTVGLTTDGTVVATGENMFGQCNVDNWSDIVAVSAGGNHTIGLKTNGTVVAVGDNSDGQCNVSNWKNIKTPQ